MSSWINESARYDSAPPVYTATTSIPMSNVQPTAPAAESWEELPPAYDTLLDLPIWSVPLSDVQSYTSPTDQPWSLFPEMPPYHITSSSMQQSPQISRAASSKNFLKKWRQIYVAVLQLLAAFIEVGAGTILASNEFAYLSKALLYGVPFWGPVCYLATGCLLLTAYISPSPWRVRLLLSFNILSIILASVGFVYNVEDLNRLCSPELYLCYLAQQNTYKIHYILISMNVLIIVLAIFAAVIGFIAWFCVSREDPQSSVIENEYATTLPPPDFFRSTSLPPPPPYTAQGGVKGNTTM